MAIDLIHLIKVFLERFGERFYGFSGAEVIFETEIFDVFWINRDGVNNEKSQAISADTGIAKSLTDYLLFIGHQIIDRFILKGGGNL